MKVSILVTEEIPRAEEADPCSLFTDKLVKILHENTIDFTLHPIPGTEHASQSIPSFKTLSTLHDFFSKVEGIDLIHNLIGDLPLFLTPFLTVPILTTFFSDPTKETRTLIQSPPPLLFFTTFETDFGLNGANSLGMISQREMESQIPAVYKKIDALTRREDHRPWGYYVVLADELDHKVKRIVVWPKKRLSLQRHRRRSEHWHVIQGKALVTLDDRQIPLEAGESVDIPKGAVHRIQNPDAEGDLAFIEVQRGDYFGEDDIERLEDDYGRA